VRSSRWSFSPEVTAEREWWRWTLRVVAVLVLVAGGVLLGLHPSASYRAPGLAGKSTVVTSLCWSPFNVLRGENNFYRNGNYAGLQPWALDPNGPPNPGLVPALAACGAVTNGHEHASEALGVGAVLLAGLSLLPRRRALATKRSLEPSPV
jgi:hypothetical protein